VLHVAPESAIGGPLALVESEMKWNWMPGRQIELKVDAGEPARRRASSNPPPKYERGYGRLFLKARDTGQPGVRLRFFTKIVRTIGMMMKLSDPVQPRNWQEVEQTILENL
jgi:dihydroxy-acid dehydratase